MLMANGRSIDEHLHAADVDHLEERILALALERTGARHGALFLAEPRRELLVLACHVAEGVIVNHPGTTFRRRRDGRPNGIAWAAYDRAAPYLCNDTSRDPSYTPYFSQVSSILAVPTSYQGRPIGVVSVASLAKDAFDSRHSEALVEIAERAAKYLRRAQLYRSKRSPRGRPFLIKGLSSEWLEVERQIEQIAGSDAPVLIQGESGTGKELVAHAIHFNSGRAERRFVAVNCAAIPEQLLETTLFGHVRGAFTGASTDRLGELRKADGGTLFLDEVAELPLGLQAKLLRALEDQEIQPVGSDAEPVRVDVRLLCATNRNLRAMVEARSFREDLFHRVGIVTLELPPLRSYKDNLEVLALVALRQAAERHDKSVTRISPEALATLAEYDFPGNVRELKNLIERGVLLAPADEIRLEDLPRALLAGQLEIGLSALPEAAADTGGRQSGMVPVWRPELSHKTLRELREECLGPIEARYLRELLVACDGDVREAARRADVNIVTMYRLLKRRGLKLRRTISG
jgi:transcriptional regulator with GAF, ATPase, and Fis domain